jgi:Co/Zn/Cd efflux system component
MILTIRLPLGGVIPGDNMRRAVAIINVVAILFISLILAIPAITSWNTPVSIIDLMMAGCLILGTYWGFRAMTLLSPEGQDEYWNITLWSKLCAGQENFTPDGWRYWLRVRYSVLLLFVLFLSRSFVRMWL